VAQLPDVAQALERLAVEHVEGRAVETDVVPEGIADDFEVPCWWSLRWG
jgi:hypothetical protein